jgi:DNA repair exonuclease SbcCD ATPase subunit
MSTHVSILCPSCRLYRQIRTEYLGHRVVCRRCGHKFEARRRDDPQPAPAPPPISPAPAAVARASEPADGSPEGERPRPRVAPAIRAPEHRQALKQLREMQDWLSQLQHLEQARATPLLAPASAPGSELEDLRAERDRLRAELEALAAHAQGSDRLVEDLDAVRKERDHLAALLQDLRTDRDGAPPVHAPGSEPDPDAVRDERDRLRARVAELQRQADEARRLEPHLQAGMDRVNNLWAHLEEEGQATAPPVPDSPPRDDAEPIERLAADLRTVGVERDRLAAELHELRQQRDLEHDGRSRAATERLDRLAAELAAARDERDRLAIELNTSRNDLDRARAQEPDAVRALRQELDGARAEGDRLRAQVAELRRRTAEADRLEAQLGADLARVNGLWARLEEDQGVLSSSGPGALDEVTRERDRLRDQVQDLRAEMDRVQETVKAELAKANRLWAELQEAQGPGPSPDPAALEAVTRERDQLRDEIRTLRGRVQAPEHESHRTED